MDRGRRLLALVSMLALSAAASLAMPTTSAGATARPADRGDPAPSYRQSIVTALDDIQDYWSHEYRGLYGTRYVPVPQARIIAARPGVKIPRCQGHRLT